MSVCVMQKWPGNLPALLLQHGLDPSYASCMGGTRLISCVPVQGGVARKGSVHPLEKKKEKEKEETYPFEHGILFLSCPIVP